MNKVNKRDVVKAVRDFQFLIPYGGKITGAEFSKIICKNYAEPTAFKYAAAVSKYCAWIKRENGKLYVQHKSYAQVEREEFKGWINKTA